MTEKKQSEIEKTTGNFGYTFPAKSYMHEAEKDNVDVILDHREITTIKVVKKMTMRSAPRFKVELVGPLKAAKIHCIRRMHYDYDINWDNADSEDVAAIIAYYCNKSNFAVDHVLTNLKIQRLPESEWTRP